MRPVGGEAALLLALALCPPASAQEPVLEEEVETHLVLVDLRVVDREGEPIEGLGPDSFRVRVDGRPVRVTSVTSAAFPADRPGESRSAALPGRRLVLFFQRSLVPSRILGLMRLREEAKRFIGRLEPEDRVAVFLHDWSLKFFQDFTVDRDRILRILDESIVSYRAPDVAPWVDPDPEGLGAHYDASAAQRAATPEKGLLVVARALRHLPGPKSLLYLGWGMGRFDAGVVSTRPGHGAMREALIASRTALFALDTTQADYHTLELPLTRVALETGGFYVKTFPFPVRALDQVERAITTHYELAFVKPDLPSGSHRIRVRLVGRPGVVYHREIYED